MVRGRAAGGSVLNREVREGITEQVTSEQRSE